MIAVTYIKRNIKSLTHCFNKSSAPLLTLLYAKLVIIEVGGWVEMSMDDIVRRTGAGLTLTANLNLLDGDIIKKNYGFDYELNFRKMLLRAIGIVKVEALEKRLDTSKHTKMKAALTLLKQARNAVAHTYVKNPAGGVTITAPSVALAHFTDIYDGLKDIEAKMKVLKLIR